MKPFSICMITQGDLQSAVLTNMNNFFIVRTVDFRARIREGIAEVLTVSNIKRASFRFTGWDVEKYEDIVRISMKDYAKSLKEIDEMWKVDRHERLSRIQINEYRKLTRKLSWLTVF